MLLDFAMFFDTLLTSHLVQKMHHAGISLKLQRLAWNLKKAEKMRIDTKYKGTECFKIEVGAAQGSSWSPKKGVIYTAKMQVRLDNLAETKTMAPSLGNQSATADVCGRYLGRWP